MSSLTFQAVRSSTAEDPRAPIADRGRGWQVPLLAPLTAAYAVGIATDAWLILNVHFCVVAMGFSAAVSLGVRKHRGLMMTAACVAMASLGAAHHHQRMRSLSADHLYLGLPHPSALARVQGVIRTRPHLSDRASGPFARWTYDSEYTYFELEVEKVSYGNDFRRVSGVVGTYVNGYVLDLKAGQSVEILGQLEEPRPPANPGALNWRAQLHRQGIWLNLYVEGSANVIRGRASDASWVNTLKEHSASILASETSGGSSDEAGLLETMILGRRSAVDNELQESFVRTGCAHLLAVSGSNVAILMLCVWRGSQFFGVSGRRSMILAMLVILFYGLLVDPFPPVRRAMVMGLISAFALFLGRPAWVLHSLTLSALILLMLNPALLADASFLLSYACMLGLLVVYPAMVRVACAVRVRWDPACELRDRIAATQRQGLHRRMGRGVLRVLGRALAVSLATTLMTLPILAYYFGRVPVWSGLNTALVLPLFTVIVVLGFLTIAAGLVLPTLGMWLSWGLNALTTLLIAVVRGLDAWFGVTVHIAPPGAVVILTYYFCLGGAVACSMGWIRWRREYLLLLLALPAAVVMTRPTSDSDTPRFTALAVGRGLATVLELPGGAAWIYDCGSGNLHDAGRRIVLPYLHQRGIRRVNSLLISHANLDHYSGVPGLMESVQVGRVFVGAHAGAGDGSPTTAKGDDPWGVLESAIHEYGKRPTPLSRESPTLRFEDTRFDVLWPPSEPPWPLSENDASLVIRVRHGERRILLCGDIEERVQRWLMENENIRADVLLLPHHGSVRTCLAEFAERVDATVEIVSNTASQGWQPSHTDPGLFHTGYDGAVSVALANDAIEVSTFLSRRNERLYYPD